ncbi:MAG: hypothetical protein ACFFB8_17780, partial [Promethearchaeota archaeon]
SNDSVGNNGFASVIVRKDITAPDIIISKPNPYDLFGKIPPIVVLQINDPNLDTIWYKLFNDTKSTSNYIWTDGIEQNLWDEFNSGIVTIRFYANDTLGNTRFSDITIKKDITNPTITISSPNPYDLFGTTSPSIVTNIYDQNLDQVWYQLTNGLEFSSNYTWIGNISQNVWDEMGNGTVTIIFYANDTLSNFNSQSITVRKDIIAPIIFINSPLNYTIYGRTPPEININVEEPNLNNIWYQIDNGTILTGNYSWMGLIDQTVWDEIGNGTVSIIFYSDDAVGNLNSTVLILKKDIIAPEIVIQEPSPYDLFGKSPPIVSVNFNDPYLSNVWYQLNNGTINTLNITWMGIIEQNIWDQVGNGTIYLTFYANDSLGNFGSKSIVILKDIIDPKITINYPTPYQIFGASVPNIDIDIEDKNLHTTWYQLMNASTTTQNYTWTGTIDQNVWDQIGNGTVTIYFYANDSMGNFNFAMIEIIKDLNAPIINIIEPEESAITGVNAPEFKIYISGVDIDQCWYIFSGDPFKYFFIKDDGITIININQTKWEEFGNGTVTIELYVNDSVSNIAFDTVELRKDIFTPEVTINLPIYEGYWNKAPILNISYSDPNYDNLWYEIAGFSGNLINNTEQTIDNLIWEQLGQGRHQLYIYANDTAGNVNDTYVFTIYKDTLAPLITINTPVDGSYSNAPPIINIVCFDPNFDTLWYGNGIFNITLLNNTDQSLDWEIWDDLPEGLYHIFIYANDTFGYINNNHILTLYKDTEAPIITIDTPIDKTTYSSPPIFYIIASDPNIDTLWYKVGINEIEITKLFQDFDAIIWNNLDQGEFQVEIYANDTFGHINSNFTLLLYKDTLAPKVVINSPLNQTYWNTRPILNITAYDPNLETIYCMINTTYFSLNNNTQTYLPFGVWSNIAEGEFKIQFFAVDKFGHLNDSYTLTLFKDTILPNITIYYPLTNSLYGTTAPDFSIFASKFNLDKVWYTLIGYTEYYLLSEFSGTINQEAWDNFGNGTVTIRFYANDTTGNIKMKEVIVMKDIYAPHIKVYQPSSIIIWNSPPIINVSAFDSDLDSIWYKIGSMKSNIINNMEVQVDNLIWENISEGKFYLYIYANDSVNNINDTIFIVLYKDTLAPQITINSPFEYQVFENVAPYFNLTIIEDNLDTRWYTLNGGLTNTTFNNNIGQINKQVWDEIWGSHPDGALITIRFYANDSLNHLGYQDVIIKIKKSELFELANPTMLITAGAIEGILGISTISIKKNKKFKRMDKKQKMKLNSILYLSMLLTGLLLLTSFI